MVGYLKINSFRNKITDLSVFMQYGQLDFFVVSETTVDNSFPSAHFMVNDYEVRVRGDRDKYGDLVQFYQK